MANTADDQSSHHKSTAHLHLVLLHQFSFFVPISSTPHTTVLSFYATYTPSVLSPSAPLPSVLSPSAPLPSPPCFHPLHLSLPPLCFHPLHLSPPCFHPLHLSPPCFHPLHLSPPLRAFTLCTSPFPLCAFTLCTSPLPLCAFTLCTSPLPLCAFTLCTSPLPSMLSPSVPLPLINYDGSSFYLFCAIMASHMIILLKRGQRQITHSFWFMVFSIKSLSFGSGP